MNPCMSIGYGKLMTNKNISNICFDGLLACMLAEYNLHTQNSRFMIISEIQVLFDLKALKHW